MRLITCEEKLSFEEESDRQWHLYFFLEIHLANRITKVPWSY